MVVVKAIYFYLVILVVGTGPSSRPDSCSSLARVADTLFMICMEPFLPCECAVLSPVKLRTLAAKRVVRVGLPSNCDFPDFSEYCTSGQMEF
jgi:hypothetical protein